MQITRRHHDNGYRGLNNRTNFTLMSNRSSNAPTNTSTPRRPDTAWHEGYNNRQSQR